MVSYIVYRKIFNDVNVTTWTIYPNSQNWTYAQLYDELYTIYGTKLIFEREGYDAKVFTDGHGFQYKSVDETFNLNKYFEEEKEIKKPKFNLIIDSL